MAQQPQQAAVSIADKLSGAKNALATAGAKFPTPKAPATPAPKVSVAPKPSMSTGEPEKGIGNELKAKQDNIDEYMKAIPKMHKGGPVLKDGPVMLKAGEHVLAKGEADKARKHALMASGMKSLAVPVVKAAAAPAKPAVKAAPKGDNNSMSIEGANVIDKTEAPGKIPPAPRSPLKQDDAYQKQRVSTT